MSTLRDVVADLIKIYKEIDDDAARAFLNAAEAHGDSFIGISYETPLGEVELLTRRLKAEGGTMRFYAADKIRIDKGRPRP